MRSNCLSSGRIIVYLILLTCRKVIAKAVSNCKYPPLVLPARLASLLPGLAFYHYLLPHTTTPMSYPSTCCLLRHSTLYLCAWILTVGQAVYSQNIAPSPNATALGTYADVPVNNYTGVPNISIPLHTVTSRDISLPITLSYHASGIKVAQEASWVGLGWALQAGGVITRTVRSIDDLSVGRGYPYGPDLPPPMRTTTHSGQ